MTTSSGFSGGSGRLAAVLSIILAAFMLAACGGGSGDTEFRSALMAPGRAEVDAGRCAVPSPGYTKVDGKCLAADTGRLAAARRKGLGVSSAAAAAITPDQLMNWAEASFADVFTGHQATLVGPGYVYRFYTESNAAIGVTTDGGVYLLLLDLGSELLYVGQIEDFSCEVVPTSAGCGPVTGGTFGTGNFVVNIADNSIPPSAGASPVATAAGSIPENVIVKSYETNVTSGAKAFTLKIGSTGFSTATVGSVRLEVPFDADLVPDKTKLDSLHLLLRILNADDNSVVNLTGQIVGGRIVADLTGFPSSATVTVIFNPSMDVAVSDSYTAESLPITKINSQTRKLDALTNTKWEARKWAVIYDTVEVTPEVQKFLGLGSIPTPPQIRSTIKQQVADHAADVAATYQDEGFRSPNLYVAKTAADPGGITFGTAPRYLLHYQKEQSANFTGRDPHEIISPDGNHYGRIYIQDTDLNEKYANIGMSIYGTVAHEMFHAVQSGYNLSGIKTIKGVREGTATAYGNLLDLRHNVDALATPQVRLYPSNNQNAIKRETFKPEHFLLTYEVEEYSNQDFFVYLARLGGNNNYRYLATLFEQLRLTIEDDAKRQPDPAGALAQPSLETVYRGFDLFLRNYGVSLLSVYENFVQQRAIEHNLASRFGRPGETTDGVATELFNSNRLLLSSGFEDLLVGALASGSLRFDDFTPLRPLSARVLRLRPSAMRAGAAITVAVAPSKGAVGTTLSGWVYRRPSAGAPRTATPIQSVNTIDQFGADAADEVVLVLINPSFAVDGVGVAVEIKAVDPANNTPALVGTSPSVTKVVAATPDGQPLNTITGSGSWSITGAGIELTSSKELTDSTGKLLGYAVYIYAPNGSRGKLTIANNAVLSRTSADFSIGDYRYVIAYHPLRLRPVTGGTFSKTGDVAVSTGIDGSTMTIDYVMPNSGSNSFQMHPQFEVGYDQDTYLKSGVLWRSDRGLVNYYNFFYVYVSNVRQN